MAFGIMFHHFSGKGHIKSQGSITEDKFYNIIKKLNKKFNILDAQEFLDKSDKNLLKKNDICFTFDDGLKSQFEIAFPVLKKKKIKSFFFIYTNMFKDINFLDVIRDFRFRCYKNINLFYKDFFYYYELSQKKKINLKNKKYRQYLSKYKFYSLNDRIFRYLRDKVLDEKTYIFIIKKLMKNKNYIIKKYLKKILMSKNDIKQLVNNGHVIGLHSHTHDTRLKYRSYNRQKEEYFTNKKILERNFKIKIESAAYPFGRYNNDTLKILKKLNIKIGFLSNFVSTKPKSNLEFSRIDHNKF